MLAALLAGAALLVLLGAGAPRGLERLDTVSSRGTRLRPVAAVGAAGAALVLGLPLTGLLLLAALAVARQRQSRTHRRARDAERNGAVEALTVLAAELRAGRPPVLALEVAGHRAPGAFGEALRAAASSARLGALPVAALTCAASVSCVPQALTGLAACWEVCAGTGASLASAVARLAEGLRAEELVRQAVEAELAGPQATAGLLTVLPLGGVALAAGLGAHPVNVLLHTPIGLGCLVLGMGLDLLGRWWTTRIVASAGGRR